MWRRPAPSSALCGAPPVRVPVCLLYCIAVCVCVCAGVCVCLRASVCDCVSLRFLDFVKALLDNLAADAETELNTCASKAYEDTLAPRHGWLVKNAIYVSVCVC